MWTFLVHFPAQNPGAKKKSDPDKKSYRTSVYYRFGRLEVSGIDKQQKRCWLDSGQDILGLGKESLIFSSIEYVYSLSTATRKHTLDYCQL